MAGTEYARLLVVELWTFDEVATSSTVEGVSADTDIAPGTILVFSARWSPLHRALVTLVGELEGLGLLARLVDVDEFRDLADRYEVLVLPTYVLVEKAGWRTKVGAVGGVDLAAWVED